MHLGGERAGRRECGFPATPRGGRNLVEQTAQVQRISTRVRLKAFRHARRLFATSRIERLYVAWLSDGDAAFTDVGAPPPGSGQLLIRTLPHTYEQFGTMAGVA